VGRQRRGPVCARPAAHRARPLRGDADAGGADGADRRPALRAVRDAGRGERPGPAARRARGRGALGAARNVRGGDRGFARRGGPRVTEAPPLGTRVDEPGTLIAGIVVGLLSMVSAVRADRMFFVEEYTFLGPSCSEW